MRKRYTQLQIRLVDRKLLNYYNLHKQKVSTIFVVDFRFFVGWLIDCSNEHLLPDMILYHGSRHRINKLEARQAQAANGITVPEGELLKAIYLTPDRGFAIAMAARPDGQTEIDDANHKIHFDHPELFNPEQKVFLYTVETDTVPGGKIEKIDERQYAILGVSEITPTVVEELRAGGIEHYYELTNWKREGDQNVTDEEFGRESHR